MNRFRLMRARLAVERQEDISLEDAAREAGLSVPTLRELELGRIEKPRSVRVARRIANLYGLSVDEVMDGDDGKDAA